MSKTPFETLKNGTYEGTFITGNTERKIIFRWEKHREPSPRPHHHYSADFFENDQLVISLNGTVARDASSGAEFEASLMNDHEEVSSLMITLRVVDPETVSVCCHVDQASKPWDYRLAFKGIHFRKIKINVAYMASVPLPRPLKVGDVLPYGDTQLPNDPHLEISLEDLFSRMGVDLDLNFTVLDERHLDFNQEAFAAYPEKLLWDEKALHQLMLRQFPNADKEPDWVAHLLLLRGHYGTYGTYDLGGEAAAKKTVGLMFDRHAGKQLSSPGFDSFENQRPRQGAAIFWDPLIEKAGHEEHWHLQREYTFLLIHEIGHILNLRHSHHCGGLSFMNYPDFFCEGRDEFWEQFDFVFSDKEQIHLSHGFIQNVGPGQVKGFPLVNSLGAIRDPRERRFFLRMTKPIYGPGEPVGLELIYTNPEKEPIKTPAMDPSYGDVTITITLPNGSESPYKPLVFKCLGERSTLQPGEDHTHVTILSLDQRGFWLDEPGLYELTARIGAMQPGETTLEVHTQFTREAGHYGAVDIHPLLKNPLAASFLSESGIKHEEMRQEWERFVKEHPHHPLSGLAHAAIAMHETPIISDIPQKNPYNQLSPGAKKHLAQAIEFGELPMLQRRALIDIYDPPQEQASAERGFTARLRSWAIKFKRLFHRSNFLDFIGTHHLNLTFGKGSEATTVDAILTIQVDDEDANTVTYALRFPSRPQHDHEGTGTYLEGPRQEDPIVHLEGTSTGSGMEFQLILRYAVSLFSKNLYVTGKIKTGGGGGGGGTPVSGTGSSGNPGGGNSSGPTGG